jgi:hypothetical protein
MEQSVVRIVQLRITEPTFRTVCFSYPVQEFCKTAMSRESVCQVKVGRPVLSLHPRFQIWNQGSSPPSFHGVVPPFLPFSHWSLFLFFLVVRVVSTKFSGFCLHIYWDDSSYGLQRLCRHGPIRSGYP